MNREDLTARYQLEGELGRGSIGVVYRATDTVLGRPVAIKILRPELRSQPRHRTRFQREARIGAALCHPNIIPVFDVGAIDVGADVAAPCLVMARLTGLTLRTLIHGNRVAPPRLLGWFSQVCNAVAFAHAQGIMHRDLKPAHVFVGDFGEVVVADWGLARWLRRPAEETDQDVTRAGDVVGTPAYMAPEQADGAVARVDHRADIYALGAILYELLTGTRAYEASRSVEVLRALRQGPPEPPRQRAPHRDISATLEAVCLKAMARDPNERYESALDLAANLEAHLDAQISHAIQVKPAPEPPPLPLAAVPTLDVAARLTDGRSEAAAFARHLGRGHKLQAEATRLMAGLNYDAPAEARAEGWRLEREARDALEQAGWHLGQAVEALSEVAHDRQSRGEPLQREARELLGRLHMEAGLAAEQASDVLSAVLHRARAETFDDGPLSPWLSGRATLTVHTDPPEATVHLAKVDDRSPVWSVGAPLRIGQTPLANRTVNAARLHLRLVGPDGLSVRLPLVLGAGDSRVLELTFPKSRQVPPGFAFISGGSFVHGADDRAPGAAPQAEVDLSAFCLARQPVTWEEYFEFLDDLLAVGADVAPHLPRLGERPLVEIASRGLRWCDEVSVERGSPIRFVSFDDAQAYAAWLGRRLRARLRLPTEVEWAYAAGEADGRTYPWGSRFEPGLADARRRNAQGPAPVSLFPADESPFGIRSLAGGVREWTATLAEGSDQGERYILRGGSWRAWPDECRLGARVTAARALTHRAIGIRLAADVLGL